MVVLPQCSTPAGPTCRDARAIFKRGELVDEIVDRNLLPRDMRFDRLGHRLRWNRFGCFCFYRRKFDALAMKRGFQGGYFTALRGNLLLLQFHHVLKSVEAF